MLKIVTLLITLPVTFILLLTASLMLPVTQSPETIENSSFSPRQVKGLVSEISKSSLKVLTLNVAHGRGNALNQIFLNRKTFESNLRAISQLIHRSEADIVALQEIDKSSLWSGNFDHAAAIASQTGFQWKAHAGHAKSWLFNYGTAVLSSLPITNIYSKRFAPTPPTLRKGFVISHINWSNPHNPMHTIPIDVVSVHLDFLSESARTNQIDDMVNALSHNSNPMIILGDFNSEWQVPMSPVHELAKRLKLKAFAPEARDLATHQNTRIDWILLSPTLAFKSYSVLPDIVSDHQAVLAEIELTDRSPSSI